MKKRLLAAALVLVMAFLLLPMSALAADGMRDITFVFHTADVRDAGTDDDVWIEIEYTDGSYWGNNRSETPILDHSGTDFDRGATDTYTFSIPDKPVKRYTIVKDGKNDWKLDTVEIDRALYEVYQWMGDYVRYTFFADSNTPLRPLTVVFHTADETDAGTDNDVWIEIDYEDGTHWGSNRSETPKLDHDGTDFDRGAADSYTFSILDKPVKSYTIVKDGKNDWMLDTVEIDGFLYEVYRCLGDYARYTINADSSKPLRPLTAVFYTTDESGAGTNSKVWIEIEYEDGTFFGRDNRSETPYLDHDGLDFSPGATDEYTFSILDKPVKSYTIKVKGTDVWLLDGVDIDGVKYVTPERRLSYEDSFTIEVGKSLLAQQVCLSVETGDWEGKGTDGSVYVTFYVQDPQNPDVIYESKCYDLDNPGDDFRAGETDTYYLEGVPAGNIISCDFCLGLLAYDEWDLESVSINGGAPIYVHHTFVLDETYTVEVGKASNTGSAFTSVNTGMIIGISVPVIVIAAAAVVLVLRKKKKNSADTVE